jgi:putative ABC transport system permease protein
MMESVRERTAELGILKALGFSNTAILTLVVMESVVLCVVACLIGLALAAMTFPLAHSYVYLTALPAVVLLAGVAVAAGVAVLSALIPALLAVRLSVVEALAAR